MPHFRGIARNEIIDRARFERDFQRRTDIAPHRGHARAGLASGGNGGFEYVGIHHAHEVVE